MTNNQADLFADAERIIPGGVNSPVRAWKAVGKDPVFVDHALGGKIFDTSGRSYIDYVLSWGPMILGHAHPGVIDAICRAAGQGTSFGAPTTRETEMAGLIVEAIPSIEQVRMTSSGTEAAMTAVRLARGCTGKDMIIKFDGCYHGHADSLLVKAGSGVATLGIPGSPGVPGVLAGLTLSLPYNDQAALEEAIHRYADRLAAVIVEPVAGNMGVVPPAQGYLKKMRELTAQHDIILIFDEVITGFRFGFCGYQDLCGIEPDLTCLGKIIGGGLPVGALGGKKKFMQRLAPAGDVYQAGTLSGNPLAMSAGIATLNILKAGKDDYALLAERADTLCREVAGEFSRRGIACCLNKVFSMFTVFFREAPVRNLADALESNTNLYARFFHGMMENGVWLAPSQFEAGFLSFAHTDADIDETLSALTGVLKNL
ncbi:MAG TPA: glutamate-1-semialdehyde 2,1-aminomutase [Smithellaceae bacterium]|jgi:glutamate-1-semialdehyde 2,1-aminomutase|nr:glutamate-1-semialdehyde 2,1-aminomutase [Smithellaceae bacterium]HQF83739.1 glutamate-1-semialdehyde 2,1-aminomutase [Smithellaceae bacterium]HQG79856.1 glutamate-1-semialdehyde 2,1-aminomutase [Smithellaceae bacterium]